MNPSGTRVLVIDDSAEITELFKAILERQGYEVTTKNSPKDISGLVQLYKIDILFLDVILQSINGKTICKELKSDPRTNYFPIILMAANPANLKDYRECDADDALEKPFDLAVLTEKISYWTKDGNYEKP